MNKQLYISLVRMSALGLGSFFGWGFAAFFSALHQAAWIEIVGAVIGGAIGVAFIDYSEYKNPLFSKK